MRAAVILAIVAVALIGLVHSHPLAPTLVEQEIGSDLEPAETGSDFIRQKRTVGVWRQLFPNFSQYVDRAIQMLTSTVFRVIGRLVLQGGSLGGGGANSGGGGGGGESRISITLPTYPPLPDEDEESSTEAETTDSGAQEGATSEDSPAATTTTTQPPANDEENAVAESQVSEVRAKRETENEEEEEDLDEEATGDNNEVAEEDDDGDESELEAEQADGDDPRNKRFLNFNLAGGAHAAPGSGAGSGNFIFDIIRLIAGSGTTAEQDEAANAAGDAKADYGVGVPGPLTRLFVIANRGVANLIQDLILRMAQTSERLVNFKARLITSLI